MNLKDTYNKIAEEWHKDHQTDDWWVEGTDAFASYLPSGGSVLDVGCGGGVKSRYLLKKGFTVTETDLSENLIAIAKREVSGAQFFVADMRDLSSVPGEFDGVFAQTSLLHIPKKEVSLTLTQFAKKLKPHGFVYLAVKGIRTGSPEEEIVEENDYGYSYKRFFSYFSMEELEKYLTDLGFKVVYQTSTLVGKTNWLQIVGQKI